MTYKEFKLQVIAIFRNKYVPGPSDPIEYGIQRARFEEDKLKRLIALADSTNFSTAKARSAGWARELERVHSIRQRLEQRQMEADTSSPSLKARILFPSRAARLIQIEEAAKSRS